MRWAFQVARMSEKSNAYRVWRANLKDRKNLEDLGKDGKIILK
jgi:hypothetical protein